MEVLVNDELFSENLESYGSILCVSSIYAVRWQDYWKCPGNQNEASHFHPARAV